MIKIFAIFILFFGVVFADDVEGRVLAGLGEGVQGISIGLGLAELLHGAARETLLNSTTGPIRALLKEAEDKAASLGLKGEQHAKASQLRKSFQVPTLRHYLQTIVGSILGPKLVPLITGTNITESSNIGFLLNITDDSLHVDYIIRLVLFYEKLQRIDIETAKKTVTERLAQVLKRQRAQRSELIVMNAGAMFHDGFEVYDTLSNGVAATEEVRRRNLIRRRHVAQITNAVKRMHRSERSLEIYAGRYMVSLFVSKVACLEDAIAHMIVKVLDVTNDASKLTEAINVANKLLKDAYDFNEEEQRFLSATGALIAGVSVFNEQALRTVMRDMIGLANTNRTSLEITLGLDIATMRRNGRVLARRARKEIVALYHGCDLFIRAEKIKELQFQEKILLFEKEEQALLQFRKLKNREYKFLKNREALDRFNFEDALDGDVEAAPTIPDFQQPDDRSSNRFLITQQEEDERLLKQHKAFLNTQFGVSEHELLRNRTKVVREEAIKRARAFADGVQDAMEGDALYQDYIAADQKGNKEEAKAALLESIRHMKRFVDRSIAHTTREVQLLWHEFERKDKAIPVHLGIRHRIFINGMDVNHLNRTPRMVRSRSLLLERVNHNQPVPGHLSRQAMMRLRGFGVANEMIAQRIIRADGKLMLPGGNSRIDFENGINQFKKETEMDGVGLLRNIHHQSRDARGKVLNSTFAIFQETVRTTLQRAKESDLKRLHRGVRIITKGMQLGRNGILTIAEGMVIASRVIAGKIGFQLFTIARRVQESPDPSKKRSAVDERLDQEHQLTENEMIMLASDPFHKIVPKKHILRTKSLIDEILIESKREQDRKNARKKRILLEQKLEQMHPHEIPKELPKDTEHVLDTEHVDSH